MWPSGIFLLPIWRIYTDPGKIFYMFKETIYNYNKCEIYEKFVNVLAPH